MNLQTKIKLKPQPQHQLDFGSKILLLGSCFSENIGNKFDYYKFQSTTNPFGILFHPLAIENLVKRSIYKDYYCEEDLHFYNEQWCCLDAHSKLNSSSKEELLIGLNRQIDNTHQELINVTHVVITLGTSWVYRYMSSDAVVANCHKLPQKLFQKELLLVETIAKSLEALVSLVKRVNPKVIFLFTVSPVRHIKDGFIENTRSKSHLITAIHQVIAGRKQIYYFPSYEIMMDELRDYRFYTADMLHPNEVAIDYIWERFNDVMLSNKALETMKKIKEIQKGLSHKPFNPDSRAHQTFMLELNMKIKKFKVAYPDIEFTRVSH